MKKAEVEIQFNWIFLLIAGSLILGLIFMVAGAIKKSSDDTLNYEITHFLDEIFMSTETNVDTERTIGLAGKEIMLECDFYTIKGSGFEGQNIQARSVFSPDTIKGSAIAYSKYWEAPFKVNSFLYITSSEIRYALVDDHSHARILFDLLPENMNKAIIEDPEAFENENNYKVRFIFIGEDPVLPSEKLGIPDKSITAIKITPSAGFPDSTGRVDFYVKEDDAFILKGTSYYLGEAALLGTVFSENAETYDCNLAKALKRLSILSESVRKRLSVISAANIAGCIYTSATDRLRAINTLSSALSVTEATVSSLYSAAYGPSGLKEENEVLQRQSCPAVY